MEKKFIVWGSGTPIREWLYIEDFTKILHIMLKRISHSIYPINIGQKKGYSIKFTANLIKKILKYDCKIIFDKNFSDGEPKKILDNKIIKKYIKNYKIYNFKEGVSSTVNYYKNNIL